MAKGGNLIEISVSRTGTSWTFSGADDDAGNMIVDGKGAVHINFKRAAGQTWQFVKPHIQFGQYGSPKNQPTIPGVFQVTAAQPDEIRVVDTNSQSPKTAGFYVYSLHTDAGVIDPMIVNNGGP